LENAKTGMRGGECEENERGYWSYCLGVTIAWDLVVLQGCKKAKV